MFWGILNKFCTTIVNVSVYDYDVYLVKEEMLITYLFTGIIIICTNELL